LCPLRLKIDVYMTHFILDK